MITEAINSAVDHAFQLRPHEREVFKDMVDKFTCLICRDIIKTDVIVGTCCGTVIGCKECLDTWYECNETCPKPREES